MGILFLLVMIALSQLSLIESLNISNYPTHEIDMKCGPAPIILSGTALSAIVLKSSYDEFQGPLNCNVYIMPHKARFGIITMITHMDLKTDGPHCEDYVQIFYDGQIKDTKKICNETLGIYVSNPPLYEPVHIIFHRESKIRKRSFEIVFTQFKLGSCNTTTEFKCDEAGRCIWSGLTCDGVNNCGDNSDEKCGAKENNLNLAAIIGGIVAAVVVVSVAFAVFVVMHRRHSIANRTSRSNSSDNLRGQQENTSYSTERPRGTSQGQPCESSYQKPSVPEKELVEGYS